MKKKNSLIILFIILLLISFVAVNIGASLFFSSTQIDLTKEQKYTLSDTTTNWLDNNQNIIYIKLYLSPNLDTNYPQIGQYSRYVRRFLEQYKLSGHHKISLTVEEVKPYAFSEKEAKNNGIRSFLDKSGQQNLYFGATFANDEGQSFTVPFFEAGRQHYLEHDVSRIMSKLNGYENKSIAVMSPLMAVMQVEDSLDNSVDWPFIKQLRNDYNLVYLNSTTPQIPFDVDMLMLINPQNLSRVGLYAIDQYLLRGGKIMIVNDPVSEVLLNTNDYKSASPSNLMPFYQNLGLRYDDNIIVGDEAQTQSTIIKDDDGTSRLLDYPLWLELDADHINQSNAIGQGLQKMRFNSIGAFAIEDSTTTKITPLLTSSAQAGSLNADEVRYGSQYSVREAFKPDGKVYNLSVLLEGKFTSSFHQNIVTSRELEDMLLPFLPVSIKPGKLLAIADSDFLFQSNWNQGSNYTSPYDYVPYTNNLDFVERSIDFLSDNNQLLSVAPKSNFDSKQTVGASLYRLVYAKYANEYELYRHNISYYTQESNTLLERIQDQEVVPSVAVIKQAELLQRNAQTNQESFKKLSYKIQEENKLFQKLIIILNSFVFPAFLIILLALFGHALQKANKKQALRYINE